MKHQSINKYISWMFVVLFTLTVVYLIAASVALPEDDWGGEKTCRIYGGSWEQVFADGSTQPLEVPGHCDSSRGQTVVIQSVIPEDIDKDTYLVFRSAKQNMNIYIGDTLVRSFSTDDTRWFGTAGAVVYVFVEVSPEDVGKTLRVESCSNTSYSGYFYTVYEGSQMEVWSMFIRMYGAELLVAFLVIAFSVVTIIASIVLRVFCHSEMDLLFLGFGILLAGGWIVANSVLRQLIFANMSVVNDMAFLMIMLLPLPYLFYLNQIQKYRYGVFYAVSEIIAVSVFVVCVVLHMTGAVDYATTNTYADIIYVIIIFSMIVTLFVDWKRKYIYEYKYVAFGLIGACLGGILQIIAYFNKTEVFNGVILEIGLMILLVFAIINSINKLMQSEREKQHAISASEAKGRFLAHMSHEIRTPINAVLGLDTMILRESKEPAIRGYALDIQSAGQGLLALINDILDLTKVESGKMELVLVEYDFSSLIHDVINMIQMKADSKSLEICLDLDENLPSALYGDDVRIRQVLVNLMNNAVKYTEKGSVKLSVSGEKEGDEVLLHFSVKDTGIGIKEEDIGKLFPEFERIEEKRNHNVEGTGLGMSITVELLSLMGSRIQVQSVYGEGSDFYFDLKQKIVNAEPIGDLQQRIDRRNTDSDYEATFTAPDAHVLVVDDNAMNRKVFINLIKETQIQVDEAGGGYECLAKASENKYDLIFLDHMMPDLDGCETLHRMKAMENFINADTPVIVLTANAISGAREKYMEEGFQQFLSKPIEPAKLEKVLRDMLPEAKLVIRTSKKAAEAVEETKEDSVELLPELEGIRWDYALTFLQDRQLLHDTACEFAATAKAEIQELIALYGLLPDSIKQWTGQDKEAEDLRQYRVKVHAMKTTAAMIGAIGISELARLLEYAARDERLEDIHRLMPFFIEEWNLMAERTQILLPEQQEENLTAADSQTVCRYLDLLEAAIDELDIDVMDEISSQLKQYRYEDEVQELVDGLCGKIYAIEYEECGEWIQRLKSCFTNKEAE